MGQENFVRQGQGLAVYLLSADNEHILAGRDGRQRRFYIVKNFTGHRAIVPVARDDQMPAVRQRAAELRDDRVEGRASHQDGMAKRCGLKKLQIAGKMPRQSALVSDDLLRACAGGDENDGHRSISQSGR